MGGTYVRDFRRRVGENPHMALPAAMQARENLRDSLPAGLSRLAGILPLGLARITCFEQLSFRSF